MATGTIKNVISDRGFGFLEKAGFGVQPDPRGPRAINVRAAA